MVWCIDEASCQRRLLSAAICLPQRRMPLQASRGASDQGCMAASKGKNAKPKGKSAPKKPSAKTAASPPAKHSASASSTVVSVEPATKRRQVARRHTDEQVERAMQGKLAHIPPAVLEGKTNSKGLTIREYVSQAFKQASGKQGRLGSKFWCQVNEEFGLTQALADGLADPPSDQQLDPELVDMIHLCHHENPAARRTVALERYLEYCKPMNRLSLYGLLRASQESPTMTKASARKCQIAILQYFARTGRPPWQSHA